MIKKILFQKINHRLFYLIIPFFTWVLITMPLWLSPFHPAVVAYFILGFDLYFFYKSILTIYRAVIAYQKLNIFAKINFSKKIKNNLKAKVFKHFVIIPNYKEPLLKLKQTIDAIVDSDYPFWENIYLVLAFEQREENIYEKSQFLFKEYKDKFKNNILVTFHKLKPGEEAGKASNQSYACSEIEKFLKLKGFNFKDCLITICDADSRLPKNYFSYLTYQFLKDKDRFYHFYAGPVLLYGNFWQLPFFVRVQATLSSILRVAFLEYKENFIQISTYSTNFWLLKKINFWDVDVIPEDWHIYLQAFFSFGDKVKTIPLYTIIAGDAVYSGNLIKTLINRYQQEKRWAWGVSDIGYCFKKIFTNIEIPLLTKIKKTIFIIENHLLWPTSFFILTLAASIPPLINPIFRRTVMGFFLPKISAFILTLATFGLVFYIYLDIKLRQKITQKKYFIPLPFLIIQWYFLPLISFFFSSLPALEAHTRLLIGKKIKYQVTEKK